MIKVTHYQRKQALGAFSLERVFVDVRKVMPNDIKVKVHISTFMSKGLWRRLYNIIEVLFKQADINHITGDVHFLTYLLQRRRTVLTILDCVTLHQLKGFKKVLIRLFWYVLPVRFSTVITVISTATKQELLTFINCNPDKIKVIYCPVSDCFLPDERPFNEVYPRILQIGVTNNKNIERVAEALAGIHCRWIIIGRLSAQQVAVIESYGLDYENHFNLCDESIHAQYKQSDMLVFASTYEGFGLPIIEANAVGRPVVTSTLFSMPEVAGEAACFVNPYDVVSIRAGILRIITQGDYRNRLVQTGFENIERFRPIVIAEQYAQLYRQLYDDRYC